MDRLIRFSFTVSIVLHILLVYSSLTQANQTLSFTDTPDWVIPATLKQTLNIPLDEVSNGIFYALVDQQVKAAEQTPTQRFNHYVDHIVNSTGVENNSKISIHFNEAYETVDLHNLIIWRDGISIDKSQSANIQILHNEDERASLIYNGLRTIEIIVDDVQVNDSIEYSYTITGTNPVYGNLFSYSNNLEWSVPVGDLSFRLLWQKHNKPIYHHFINIDQKDIPLEISNTKLGKEFRITQSDIKALIVDDDTPDWFKPWAEMYFSEVKSWQEISKHNLPLFTDAIKEDPSIKDLANTLTKDLKSDDEKITAILRYVQNDIRYLGIEIGENSHRPYSATETLSRKYGDCKDKTVLMISLLRAIGIEAHPALVDTETSLASNTLVPHIYAFDHVIVYLEHSSQPYWLDPTRKYQYGRLDQIYQPHYNNGLILKPDTQTLTAMSPSRASNKMIVKDYFDARDSNKSTYTSRSIYSGLSAEKQRSNIARDGLAETQRSFLSFFEHYYPDIKPLKSVTFQDDIGSNKLIAEEKYDINSFWHDDPDEQEIYAHFYSNAVNNYLSDTGKANRQHPLKLAHPIDIEQTIEIQLSDTGWNFDNEKFIDENDYFFFHYKAKYNSKTQLLSLFYHYKSKRAFVSAENYPSYLEKLSTAQEYKNYSISSPYSNANAEISSLLLMPEMWFLIGLVIYNILLIGVIVLWRKDLSANRPQEETAFYPVSILKFYLITLATFGLYINYWFYKNWQIIKNREKSNITPLIRGILYPLWYYPFYKKLSQHAENNSTAYQLPAKSLAIFYAIAIIFCNVLSINEQLILPATLLIIAMVTALLPYINSADQDSETLSFNSQWNPRHSLSAVLLIPLFFVTVAMELGVFANSAVINGNKILNHDIKYLQRKNILEPDDQILQFYSDAFLLIRSDGNGFTDRHVFSYWVDEDKVFNYRQATYKEISDIKITESDSALDNTIIKIIKTDGSDFLLYASPERKKDRRFVRELKKLWKRHK